MIRSSVDLPEPLTPSTPILASGIERQMDVIEHLPGRVALGQTLHEIDELASHRDPWKPVDLWKFAAADVAARPPKGNRGPVFHPFTTDHYGVDTMCGPDPTIETFF